MLIFSSGFIQPTAWWAGNQVQFKCNRFEIQKTVFGKITHKEFKQQSNNRLWYWAHNGKTNNTEETYWKATVTDKMESLFVFFFPSLVFPLHLLDKESRKPSPRSSPVSQLAQVLSPSPTGVKEHIGREGTWLYCSGKLHLAYMSQGCCRQLALVLIVGFKSFSGSMCTNQTCNSVAVFLHEAGFVTTGKHRVFLFAHF